MAASNRFIATTLLFVLPSLAQTTSGRGYVRAIADAAVSLRPETAKVAVGVVTHAPTATEAASRNADQAAAVISALRRILGTSAEIRTAGYSLGPVYSYPSGGTPQLTGFSASNIVEATIMDLAAIGRVIDTAIEAGANRVEYVRLSIQDEEPVRAQALRLAAQKARLKAEAIAQGLNIRLGGVVSAVEGVQSRTLPPAGYAEQSAATSTPVEPGTLEIRATVTIELEAVQ